MKVFRTMEEFLDFYKVSPNVTNTCFRNKFYQMGVKAAIKAIEKIDRLEEEKKENKEFLCYF